MDISDQATEREEQERARSLSARKPEGPAATGFCHHCGAQVPFALRWCDEDCRNDWQRAQRAG
jgi:hypothetical protein